MGKSPPTPRQCGFSPGALDKTRDRQGGLVQVRKQREGNRERDDGAS